MRRHLTFANIAASIALLIATAGGAAFAATKLPKNSVKSKQIAPGAVKTSDLRNDAVTGAKVKESTLSVPGASTVGGIAITPINVAMDDDQADVTLVDVGGSQVIVRCGNGATVGLQAKVTLVTSPTIHYEFRDNAGEVVAGVFTTVTNTVVQCTDGVNGLFTMREASGAVTQVDVDSYRETNGIGTKDCFVQGTISRY